jgi:hypothetical protein
MQDFKLLSNFMMKGQINVSNPYFSAHCRMER